MLIQKLKFILYYWFPTFAWAGVIFHLSNLPADDLPSWEVPYLDKLIHAIEFAILAYLTLRSFVATYPKKSNVFQCTLMAITVFSYALLDEFHQSFVAGRFTDVYDLVADSSGIFLILLFFRNRLTVGQN